MNIVIYRFIYPHLLCFLTTFILCITFFKKHKFHTFLSLTLIIVSFISFCFTAYLSLDLIFRDYQTETVKYVTTIRTKDIFTEDLVFDLNGTNFSLGIAHSALQELDFEYGNEYEIVYAKRTKMLISISP